MKFIYNTILLLASILLLNGCQEESFNTVKYYRDHPKERNIRIKECQVVSQMTPVQRQDCHNAAEALREPAMGGEMDRANNKRY